MDCSLEWPTLLRFKGGSKGSTSASTALRVCAGNSGASEYPNKESLRSPGWVTVVSGGRDEVEVESRGNGTGAGASAGETALS